MVGADGVHHLFHLTIFFRQIPADNGMRTFHLMVDSLADVVEQPSTFCHSHIYSQLSRHYTTEECDFKRVLQDILTVAGPVFETPQ